MVAHDARMTRPDHTLWFVSAGFLTVWLTLAAPNPAASATDGLAPVPVEPAAVPSQPPQQPPSEPPERPARGPLTAIAQDTARALTRDLPEAAAGWLPWVDRPGGSDASLEQVLAQVADELGRAAAADPDWARPAERELRALAARLASLPEPPRAPAALPAGTAPAVGPATAFRVRPLWPGAADVSPPQSRPFALIAESAAEAGPPAPAHSLPVDPGAAGTGGAGLSAAAPPGRLAPRTGGVRVVFETEARPARRGGGGGARRPSRGAD